MSSSVLCIYCWLHVPILLSISVAPTMLAMPGTQSTHHTVDLVSSKTCYSSFVWIWLLLQLPVYVFVLRKVLFSLSLTLLPLNIPSFKVFISLPVRYQFMEYTWVLDITQHIIHLSRFGVHNDVNITWELPVLRVLSFLLSICILVNHMRRLQPKLNFLPVREKQRISSHSKVRSGKVTGDRNSDSTPDNTIPSSGKKRLRRRVVTRQTSWDIFLSYLPLGQRIKDAATWTSESLRHSYACARRRQRDERHAPRVLCTCVYDVGPSEVL